MSKIVIVLSALALSACNSPAGPSPVQPVQPHPQVCILATQVTVSGQYLNYGVWTPAEQVQSPPMVILPASACTLNP